MMRLAVGPCLFEWGKRELRDFYRRMAQDTSADILYLGEVVCSKRSVLSPQEMLELAAELRQTGKEVVLSTLALVMNENEIDTLNQIVDGAEKLGIRFEANDFSALAQGEGKPMVAGPHITTYNAETLSFLAGVGVERVVFPVELSKPMIEGIIRQYRGSNMEFEVFAHGKLPLAFSARCYTARAFRLPKGNCQYKCADFPDGMTIRTQEGTPFLTLNGIQTMSDRLFTLLDRVEELTAMGVGILRLSPQPKNMERVIELFRQRLDGTTGAAEGMERLEELCGRPQFCNGYYHGRAGLEMVEPALLEEI